MPRSTRKSTLTPTPDAPAEETPPAPAPESTPSAAEPGDDPSPVVSGPGVSETEPQPETPHPTNETRDPANTAGPVGATPDATPDPVAAVAEELGPSVQSVLAAITCVDCPGAVITRPEVKLTGEQARLQLRVYQTLCDQGLTLRKQGDVYGWLLDQMLEHLTVEEMQNAE